MISVGPKSYPIIRLNIFNPSFFHSLRRFFYTFSSLLKPLMFPLIMVLRKSFSFPEKIQPIKREFIQAPTITKCTSVSVPGLNFSTFPSNTMNKKNTFIQKGQLLSCTRSLILSLEYYSSNSHFSLMCDYFSLVCWVNPINKHTHIL